MLIYPNIDPVAFELGPLTVHWYGIMYLCSFGLTYWLAFYRAKQLNSGWTEAQVSDLVFYVAVGVVVGGRLGYKLFYDFSGLVADPISVFRVWQGGMSFHGGLLGVMVAFFLMARKVNKSVFLVADFSVPMVPIGLGLGRLGNFIGAELYGRITEAPWGMVFPNAGPLPRHPTQLYQFFFEGVVLFAVLWWYSSRPRPKATVTGLFLVLYGIFRFGVEFFRQPDAHIGFLAWGWLTMGQLLSFPMLLVGLSFLMLSNNNTNNKVPQENA